MTAAVEPQPEPCAWLVGRDNYWRPCPRPSAGLVRRGRLVVVVCDKCRDRALAVGFEAEP